jgi:MFS family permease
MSGSAMSQRAEATAGGVLLTLASGQFRMTLDSSVMNVAIATAAEDVGTTVTGIQAAITLYTLVMAIMVAGGKIGSMIGRPRAFVIGCVIYGLGSLTTALAPNPTVLVIGWSALEGIGAALILPAIVALVAGNFPAEGSASPRRVVRLGLLAMFAGIAVLMSAIDATADARIVTIPLLLAGLGIGALASPGEPGGSGTREVAGDGSALPAGFPSSPTSLFRMD